MEKLTNSPFIIDGDVMHNRFFPKKNYFNYKSQYIAFPISKIQQLKTSFFGINKFNLYGFYYTDYANVKKDNISNNINEILKKYNINNISEIILFTHPRILGYVFNPVSFWVCLDKKNNLIAVLNEVNNTCKQKHSYLCFKKDLSPIDSKEWLIAKKTFYVSPFMEIEGDYKFRYEFKNDKMNFYINYLVDGKLKLSTSLKCSLKEFNTRNLLHNFLKTPFVTLRTIFLIHYQAMKLFFKNIKFYKCPKPLENNLTISNNE